MTIPGPTFSPEIRAALDAYCAAHGTDVSDLLREVGLAKIGRADLLATMRPPGRPKPTPEQPAPKRKPKT